MNITRTIELIHHHDRPVNKYGEKITPRMLDARDETDFYDPYESIGCSSVPIPYDPTPREKTATDIMQQINFITQFFGIRGEGPGMMIYENDDFRISNGICLLDKTVEEDYGTGYIPIYFAQVFYIHDRDGLTIFGATYNILNERYCISNDKIISLGQTDKLTALVKELYESTGNDVPERKEYIKNFYYRNILATLTPS